MQSKRYGIWNIAYVCCWKHLEFFLYYFLHCYNCATLSNSIPCCFIILTQHMCVSVWKPKTAEISITIQRGSKKRITLKAFKAKEEKKHPKTDGIGIRVSWYMKLGNTYASYFCLKITLCSYVLFLFISPQYV